MNEPVAELSLQEMRVLRLMARAKSDQEILCELNISSKIARCGKDKSRGGVV